MPPSSLYCCHRWLSMSSTAASNRRMAASPGVRPLPSSAEAGTPLVSAKAGTPLASSAAPATVRPVAAAAFRTERRDRRAADEAGRLAGAVSLDMSSIVVATLLSSLSARELMAELAWRHRVTYHHAPPAADPAVVARTPDAIDNTWQG